MSLSITLIHLCHEDDDTRHLTHHADLTPLLSINQFIISLEPVVWDPFHEQDQRPRTMLKHCSKLSLLEEKSASTLSLSHVGITETGVTSPSQDQVQCHVGRGHHPKKGCGCRNQRCGHTSTVRLSSFPCASI